MGLIILIVSLLYLPARHIQFSWYDDGVVFYNSAKLISDISTHKFADVWFLLTEYGVRFRPVYWFWQAGNYVLSSFNSQSHYFWHFVLILIINLYLYFIVKSLTHSKLISIFASITFLLTPINMENWYRLGPQEPLIVFLVLTSVLVWLKLNRPGLGGLIFLLAVLAKEPVIAFLIPLIFIYIFELVYKSRRSKDIEKFICFGLVGFLAITLPRILNPLNQPTDYHLSLSVIIPNFIQYVNLLRQGFFPYLDFLFLVFIIRSSKYLRLSVITLLTAGSYLLILSPWSYVLNRYLLPVTIPIVIFLGLQLKTVFKQLNKLSLVILIFVFIIHQSYNFLRIYRFGIITANTTATVQSLYSQVSKTALPNSSLLLNITPGTLEAVDESRSYLNYYYHRPDIKVDFLDLDNIASGPALLATTSLISPRYTQEQIATIASSFSRTAISNNNLVLPFLSVNIPWNSIANRWDLLQGTF